MSLTCVLFSFSLTTVAHSLCLSQQEECLEKVIKDTECLFKNREKEYQETIDQIEVKNRKQNKKTLYLLESM